MTSLQQQAKDFAKIGRAGRTFAEAAENMKRFAEAMPTAEEFAELRSLEAARLTRSASRSS